MNFKADLFKWFLSCGKTSLVKFPVRSNLIKLFSGLGFLNAYRVHKH
jgi:hypothetical protein